MLLGTGNVSVVSFVEVFFKIQQEKLPKSINILVIAGDESQNPYIDN